MAVTSITIKNNSGATLAVVTNSALEITTDNSLFVETNTDTGTITVSEASFTGQGNTVYDEAFNAILDTGCWYISKINTLPPDDYGNFWLLGSACTQIEDFDNSFFDSATGAPADADSVECNSSIDWFDMCGACTDCSVIWKLRSRLEDAMIWLNSMKDNYLYYDTTALSRWRGMQAIRTKAPEGCIGTEQDASSRPPDLKKALKLFYQYKALIMMWNYAVIARSTSTEIQSTAEDACAFVVSARRAVTECSGAVALSCTIQVEQIAGQGFYDGVMNLNDPEKVIMNIYIPEDQEMETKPFPQESGGFVTGYGIRSVNVSSVTKTAVCRFSFGNITEAGVFYARMAVFPFVKADIIYNDDGTHEIKYTGYSSVVSRETYNEARNVPTVSSFSYENEEDRVSYNIWKILVTWTYGEKQFTETFMFQTSAVRLPVADVDKPDDYLDNGSTAGNAKNE